MKDETYTIYNAPEYDEWLDEQSPKSQVQVRSRISHIQDDGHFGDHKVVGDGVWELRWKNGRRVYYADIPERKILLLLGGNKNGQDKDIRQAKNIFNKHVSTEEDA
jgi:putative addiction module killer protein